MATNYAATLQMEYADGSTRSVTFNNVTAAAMQTFKARVLELNSTIADSTTGAAYKDTFVSNNGEPINRISGAKYTATEETVIYNG